MSASSILASLQSVRRKGAPNCGLDLSRNKERKMNGIIYLVGLVVVILAVLSFFGLR